uniref:Uncharacterized protein n=1 Tax=Lepeophtheirus salmonis TaxID=72036 RepID=A0A0K2TSU7_LEPSM
MSSVVSVRIYLVRSIPRTGPINWSFRLLVLELI